MMFPPQLHFSSLFCSVILAALVVLCRSTKVGAQTFYNSCSGDRDRPGARQLTASSSARLRQTRHGWRPPVWSLLCNSGYQGPPLKIIIVFCFRLYIFWFNVFMYFCISPTSCGCGGWAAVARQTPRVSTEGAAKVTAFSYFSFQDAAENSKHCFFRGFRGTGELNNPLTTIFG